MRPSRVIVYAISPAHTLPICALLLLGGCQHNYAKISGPWPPPINPSDYKIADYDADVAAYKNSINNGKNDLAKQKRNDIAYGLMSQIDVVYNAYYERLFASKNGFAVTGDALTLGLSAAASIATNNATKTLLSALGTAFSGLSLSVDKNYFAQQTFPIIGVAMQTRRDKVRATVISNLALDTTTYPLMAVKRDLVAYLSAGSLASGLQELQEEAGAATAVPTKAPSAPSGINVIAGNSQVSLTWSPSAGATSYNIYWSPTSGVTKTTGTKITVASNSYTQTGLTNGTTYYYVLTAVNANGESDPSAQISATPNAGAPVAGAPSTPIQSQQELQRTPH
jgi:hypothetical protein